MFHTLGSVLIVPTKTATTTVATLETSTATKQQLKQHIWALESISLLHRLKIFAYTVIKPGSGLASILKRRTAEPEVFIADSGGWLWCLDIELPSVRVEGLGFRG